MSFGTQHGLLRRCYGCGPGGRWSRRGGSSFCSRNDRGLDSFNDRGGSNWRSDDFNWGGSRNFLGRNWRCCRSDSRLGGDGLV